MAGTSLIALIDDIATVLDDVSVLTKVAARKTAGVLGDDLALNAEQVSGVRAERELPVVWAVAKGSLVNKAILVPAALAISAVAPWAILPLLMVGGAFLCFEGFEKLAHKLLHSRSEDEDRHAELTRALKDPAVDLAALEQARIKGAVRTDFVLSAEIVVITLGIVADAAFGTRVAVLAGIGVIMTVGVYGLVAGIVKLDDLGLYLSRRTGEGRASALLRWLGARVLAAAPILMKLLSVVGTAAMFLVGGGIVNHGLPGTHEVIHHLVEWVAGIPAVGGILAGATPLLLDGLTGILIGALVLGAVTLGQWIWRALRPTAPEAVAPEARVGHPQPHGMRESLYDLDLYVWATHTARLVREGRFSEIDTQHLAQELDSMGKGERRALESRLVVLLAHLLKWERQPEQRSKSWQRTLIEQRKQIAKLLKDSPSLASMLPDLVADAYDSALRQAAEESGLDESDFPPVCPYALEQLLDRSHLPAL